MYKLMEKLVASTLLRTWISNTKIKDTEEGNTMLTLLSNYQQRSLSEGVATMEEAKAIADRAAGVAISCLDVLDITDRVRYIYAVLVVLFAAENEEVLKFESTDDELAFTMVLLRDIMDKVTHRNPQLRFSKDIMQSAQDLSDHLNTFDLFYVRKNQEHHS